MIRKTDKYLKRRAKVWERGYANSEKVAEYVRRETWWLLFVVPVVGAIGWDLGWWGRR